jgi:hypothetical protein
MARALCTKAIDTLKSHLGRQWNPRWAAAGFGGFTISVKNAEVAAKLAELRNYFQNNPTREITSEGLTAAACEAANAAIVAAGMPATRPRTPSRPLVMLATLQLAS